MKVITIIFLIVSLTIVYTDISNAMDLTDEETFQLAQKISELKYEKKVAEEKYKMYKNAYDKLFDKNTDYSKLFEELTNKYEKKMENYENRIKLYQEKINILENENTKLRMENNFHKSLNMILGVLSVALII